MPTPPSKSACKWGDLGMVEWLAENYGNILVLLVLTAIVGGIIRTMLRDRKKGKCCGCCKGCAKSCSCQSMKE